MVDVFQVGGGDSAWRGCFILVEVKKIRQAETLLPSSNTSSKLKHLHQAETPPPKLKYLRQDDSPQPS